jgi:large repetitive protein
MTSFVRRLAMLSLPLASLLACGQSGSSAPAADATSTTRAPLSARAQARRAAVDAGLAQARTTLANYDARSAEAAKGSAALRAPAFEWARPTGASSASLRTGAAPRTAVEAARAYLGLASGTAAARAAGSVADETVVTAVHDLGRGPVVVQLKRQVDGLDVFGERTSVALNRKLEVVARSGAAPAAAKRASSPPAFALDARAAIAAALADVSGAAVVPADLVAAEAKQGYDRADLSASAAASLGARLVAPARARKVLFPLAGQLLPAFELEVALQAAGADLKAFGYVVSAVDGAVLFRRNQVQQESNPFTYLVWADPVTMLPYDGPQGLAGTPHPTGLPDGFQADPVAQQAVTLSNFPFSQNDPWLYSDSAETWGNNVAAWADLAAPDLYSAGDALGVVSSGTSFSYPYSFAIQPNANATQIQAAVAQLFYDNNFFHDWYYDSGFDEAAGNAQYDNFGRGGEEGDFLLAEAQDFAGTDNANMMTPADGYNPRMRMYLFGGNGARYAEVTAPAGIAGRYEGQVASGFGAQSFDLTQSVVAAVPATACTALTNGAALAGKIALVDRGTCTFAVKAKAAQDAGAAGVIIRNVSPASTFGGLGGVDATVTIPVLLVSYPTGTAIGGQLGTGVTARMFRENALMRDGTVDNLIVAHEWGHFITNRLIGNASGLDSNQSGGLGEGWGDTHAMLLAVREEDAAVTSNAGYGGVYAMAGWVEGGSAALGGGNQGYYFGIRRVPYSTDMLKNPLTFRHIADGEALVPEGSAIPINDNGVENSEVHNTGEVWATMLWECYAALLRDTVAATPRRTFAEARAQWKDYLVASYKLTPNNPTLLEARDALLAAAAANDLRDYTLFFQAFAKRGAGLGAAGPDKWLSLDNNPVVESYSADPHLKAVSATFTSTGSCSDGDAYLDIGESGTLAVVLRNDGVGALAATTATPAAENMTLPASVSVPALAPTAETTVTVPVSLSTRSGAVAKTVTFTFPDGSELAGSTVEVPLVTNRDVHLAASATEDFDLDGGLWTTEAKDGTGADLDPALGVGWKHAGSQFQAESPGFVSDLRLVSPPLAVGEGDFTFSIRHRYMFEMDSYYNQYDGGVIELQVDGSDTWEDVGEQVYDGTIYDGSNPLAGRDGFTYVNWSYPDLDTVAVNLGTTYAGETVRLRFRAGADEATGWGGWTIDRVAFGGLTSTPFATLGLDAGNCAGKASSTSDSSCATAPGAVNPALVLLLGVALALRLRRRRAR